MQTKFKVTALSLDCGKHYTVKLEAKENETVNTIFLKVPEQIAFGVTLKTTFTLTMDME